MTIEFNNVLPFPLAEYPHGSESVWNRNFQLELPKKILLNASSGKGKSTFVNIIYGLRNDYSGDITINGRNISALSLDEWIELRKDKLSIVFQDLQLFPNLTVFENLELKNALTQHKTADDISAMLEKLGILEKKDQLCKNLSLGQQQRVAVIRSLLQPFELLLMDEPFSHLDENNAQICLELINTETKKNTGGYILTSLGSYHESAYDQELNL